MNSSRPALIAVLALALLVCSSVAFVPPRPFLARPAVSLCSTPTGPDPDSESTSSSSSSAPSSISPEAQARLAEKMKSWEVSVCEKERKTRGREFAA